MPREPFPDPDRRLGRALPPWWPQALLFLILAGAAAWWGFAGPGPYGGSDHPTPWPTATPTSGADTPVGSVPSPSLPSPAEEGTASKVTATPTPSPVLQAGRRAVVYGTEGEGIRVRGAPGTDAETLGVYPDGSVFTVLPAERDQYPVRADGYRWWYVRTPDGIEGWAAANWLHPAANE
ncbi:MAG TPA: SH3 domain-containing protein [Anaerolineae bacterium]|nr:SH3 domain-containing protein [Anaerolineae bacterium]HIQ06791.1 SH3 domain-containing protein [Anaerolineae bacterium]